MSSWRIQTRDAPSEDHREEPSRGPIERSHRWPLASVAVLSIPQCEMEETKVSRQKTNLVPYVQTLVLTLVLTRYFVCRELRLVRLDYRRQSEQRYRIEAQH